MGLCECGCRSPLSDEQWLASIFEQTKEEDRGYTSPCWIWQGTVNATNRYAVRRRHGKQTTVHREVHRLVSKREPSGSVHHLCHRPEDAVYGRRCLNPDHLVSLDVGEHTRLHFATITVSQIQEIERLLSLGQTYAQIAASVGLSQWPVYQVAHSKHHLQQS